MLLIFFILLILLISSFFSASETAITFASRAKIHHLVKNGNEKAKIIESLQQNLGLVISAILAFNTILNAAIVSLGSGMLSDIFGDNSTYATVLSPIIMGTFVLLYDEIIPKMLAIQNTTGLL